MSSNLPPGVTEGMIPGNRPEDMAWDEAMDAIGNESSELGLNGQDVYASWKLGVAAYLAARELKARFPFDGPEPDICDPCPNETPEGE